MDKRGHLHAEYLRPANRLVLRRRWLLLGDDSGRLLRYVEQWRRLYAEHLRSTRHGFLLRSEWLLLEYD